MKKRKTKAEKMMDAMILRAINRAIVNKPIPIMETVKIFRRAEYYAAQGLTEEQLEANIAAYVETIRVKEVA